MYEFLDRPVTNLDAGGRFLVWSMRSWVRAMGRRECPGSLVGLPFAQNGAITALQPFLRMMSLFNRFGLETFHFCQPACNHVSEHEALILSFVCGVRDRDPGALREALVMLIEEECIGDLLTALTQLDSGLERAGMRPVRAPVTTADRSVHRPH